MIIYFEVTTLTHADSGSTHDFDLAPDRQTRIAIENDQTWRWRPSVSTDNESSTWAELNAGPAPNAYATSSANDAPPAVAKAEIQRTDERHIPHHSHREPI